MKKARLTECDLPRPTSEKVVPGKCVVFALNIIPCPALIFNLFYLYSAYHVSGLCVDSVNNYNK